MVGYAFGTLGASALFAGHNPANEASRRLLIKLGFPYTHDEFYAPTGMDHPSYLLTAEDRITKGTRSWNAQSSIQKGSSIASDTASARRS